MALSGAFDCFHEVKREHFLATTAKGDSVLDVLIRYGNKVQAEKDVVANSLFGDMSEAMIAKPVLPDVEDMSSAELSEREKDLVGIYLSAHPLDDFYVVLNYVCNAEVGQLNDEEFLAQSEGKTLVVGGVVTNVRNGTTKKGSPFKIVTLQGYVGSFEFFFFGEELVPYSGYFVPGYKLLIQAQYKQRFAYQDRKSIIVSKISFLMEEANKLVENITILMTDSMCATHCTQVYELCDLYKTESGGAALYIKMMMQSSGKILNLRSRAFRGVNVTKDFLGALTDLKVEFEINKV